VHNIKVNEVIIWYAMATELDIHRALYLVNNDANLWKTSHLHCALVINTHIPRIHLYQDLKCICLF